MTTSTIVSQLSELSAALDFVQAQLTAAKVNRRQITRSLLNTEEILVEFLNAGMSVTLVVRNLLGTVTVRMSAKGPELKLGTLASDFHGIDISEDNPETESVIRSLILRAQEKQIHVKRSHGINTVVLSVQKSPNHALHMTLGGMALGILLGFLLRLILPEAAIGWISGNLLDTFSTMFINSIMLLVGPLVFCSMASCVAGFRDLTALGRIGGKVMGMYLITTCGALFISYTAFSIFQPGNPALMSAVVIGENAGTEAAVISLRSVIANIIPSNFFAAFHDSDLIQILFLGILIGVTTSLMGEHSGSVQHMLEVLNALFSSAVTLVSRALPLAVFCSMAKLLLTIELSSLSSLLYIAFTIIIAVFTILLMYSLLLLVLSRLNPLTFVRKFSSTMVSAFSLCSSSAVMPMNMQSLHRMGVSPKVYSFSIPLGATVNMDGFCVFLMINILALAKVAGLEITGSMMTAVFLSILLISIGAPGVPGAASMTIAMLLKMLGLPAEMALLVISVTPFVEPLVTMSNITGDAIVTTIVAKSEGLMDVEQFNSQNT